jgi:hypothetical protein
VAAAGATAACTAAGSEVDRVLRASRGVQARKAALEAQAGSARKLIDGIDGRVPGLNEEKKAAVSGKKFKEAARVNDELKRMGEQREQAERCVPAPCPLTHPRGWGAAHQCPVPHTPHHPPPAESCLPPPPASTPRSRRRRAWRLSSHAPERLQRARSEGLTWSASPG